jgi:hypothetical protein
MTEDFVSIELPCGLEFWIDECDIDFIYGWKLFSAKRGDGLFYVECRKGNQRILLHKLLTGADRTDHGDGNGLNNRRANLRPCTHAENMRNGRKRTVRRFKGAFKHTNGASWFSQICVNRSRVYGGSFPTEEEAARSYDDLARKYHGEFARLNFPDV